MVVFGGDQPHLEPSSAAMLALSIPSTLLGCYVGKDCMRPMAPVVDNNKLLFMLFVNT